MTAEAPLVSVVVPAFNAEATLGETLKSVGAQTHGNIEIIIVDDGSSDATARIAAAFCASEPRARLMRKENGGVASARNRGISEVRGAWIAPVDADDLWHPAKLERQLAAAAASGERVGFVYCWSRFVDSDGRVVGCPRHWSASGYAFLQLGARNFVGNGSALLIDRAALLEAGGYDEGLRAERAQGCEDLLLQLKIAARFPIACVPEHLVGYRVGHAAMSSDYAQMERSWQRVRAALAEELATVPPFAARWARAAHARGMAAAAARSGDLGVAGMHVARALALDPFRFAAFFASRAAAVARRGGRRGPAASPLFHELDPNACCSDDGGSLVARVDAARMSRLTAAEARLRQATARAATVTG